MKWSNFSMQTLDGVDARLPGASNYDKTSFESYYLFHQTVSEV